MILKLAAIMVVLFIVYIVFFKRDREKSIFKSDKKVDDEMVECPVCGTYVSKDEALISNGKFFCSNKCLLENKKS